MNKQLVLGIALRDDATFTNFYPAGNEELYYNLQRLAEGGNENFLYAWGIKACGKSHLLQATCLEASRRNQQAIYLPLREQTLSAEILQDLEQIDLICLDDVDAVLLNRNWCTELFHLYNRVRESNSRLLISASVSPHQLICELLDLRSRLAACLTFQAHALTDEDKLKALQLRANQRGFNLSEEVGLFILRHFNRDMSQLYHFLQEIDEASLIAKRRLTIPFIKQIVDTKTKC